MSSPLCQNDVRDINTTPKEFDANTMPNNVTKFNTVLNHVSVISDTHKDLCIVNTKSDIVSVVNSIPPPSPSSFP